MHYTGLGITASALRAHQAETARRQEVEAQAARALVRGGAAPAAMPNNAINWRGLIWREHANPQMFRPAGTGGTFTAGNTVVEFSREGWRLNGQFFGGAPAASARAAVARLRAGLQASRTETARRLAEEREWARSVSPGMAPPVQEQGALTESEVFHR